MGVVRQRQQEQAVKPDHSHKSGQRRKTRRKVFYCGQKIPSSQHSPGGVTICGRHRLPRSLQGQRAGYRLHAFQHALGAVYMLPTGLACPPQQAIFFAISTCDYMLCPPPCRCPGKSRAARSSLLPVSPRPGKQRRETKGGVSKAQPHNLLGSRSLVLVVGTVGRTG